MKKLEGIYKRTPAGIEVGGKQIPVRDFVREIAGRPVKKIRREEKKRATSATCYYYITGLPISEVEIMIAELKKDHRDVTAEQKTKLKKGEFSYIIQSFPEEKFFCIKVNSKTGNKFNIVNSECLVRNADNDPAGAAELIKEVWKRYGQPKLTISATAYEEYNDYIKMSGYSYLFNDERKIPVDLYNCSLDDYIRPAYYGGWCYSNSYGAMDEGAGVRLDVHSLYPSILAAGIPADATGRVIDDEQTFNYMKEGKAWFIHFQCEFTAKAGVFPFINYVNHGIIYRNAETSTFESGGKKYHRVVELTMCAPEYEAFRALYKVDKFTFLDGVIFDLTDCAKPFINMKYSEKQSLKGTGAAYDLQKVIINSITGSFSRKAVNYGTVYSDRMKRRTMETDVTRESHVAVGAWITGSGRARLATLAYENRKRFLYCDTDSLHLRGKEIPAGLPVGDALGTFGIEATFEHSVYYGQKKYIEWSNTDASVTLAGLPRKFARYLEQRLAPYKLDLAGDCPLYLSLIYDRITDRLNSGGGDVMIPYRIIGSGWMLYRTKRDHWHRLKDDENYAMEIADNARQEAREFADGTFWE